MYSVSADPVDCAVGAAGLTLNILEYGIAVVGRR